MLPRPVGSTSTAPRRFPIPRSRRRTRGTCGACRRDDPLGVGPRRPNHIFLQWKGSAAGGGYSTAPDLLRFVQALRAGRLVSPKTLDTLLPPHNPRGWYGYGFLVQTAGGKPVRGHGGSGPGSEINSEVQFFLDGSWTVVVLSNYDTPAATGLADKILELLALQ